MGTPESNEGREVLRKRLETAEKLITDLFWFIENVRDESADRTSRFFELRERCRKFWP